MATFPGVGPGRSGLIGMVRMPTWKLGELMPEFVLLELNSQQLFNFEYEPQENDSLWIERVGHNDADPHLKGDDGYRMFYFHEGKWRVGDVSPPFFYEMGEFKGGTVRLEQKGTE